MMNNRIITISRQFGSGGRTIGKLLGEKLSIPCYDSEIIEKLAEESSFSKDYIAENSEYTERGHLFFNVFSSSHNAGVATNQDYLWNIQRKIILELSEKGACVIVGRCADYILKGRKDCLNVFIHASMEKRAERIVSVYGEGKDSPEKRLRDKDKRRSTYYRFYTDAEWGALENYHIALDSGVLGIEKCVNIIASAYQE